MDPISLSALRRLALLCLLLPGLPAQADPPTPPPAEAGEAACPPAFADGALASGAHSGFEVNGEPRSFTLLLPEEHAPGAPLLVAFHGTTEDGARFVRRARLADFAAAGMVVVAPDAVGHGTIWPVWDALRLPEDDRPNPDLALFDRLVSCLVARLDLDPEQVFVAGHSAGGIFANRVLRTRSERVRGGIVGSGIFELTGPPAAALGPMTVIVTWGGENDVYSGRTPGGTRVAGLSFAEQAALASRAYAAAEVRQVHCRGEERGHAWLTEINGWMAAALLDPKTAAAPPVRPGVATCSARPARLPDPPFPAPQCMGRDPSPCASFCDATARCVLANATVGPVMATHLARIGITPKSCVDCVRSCEQRGEETEEDRAMQRCLAGFDAPAVCDPGLAGALPVLQHIDRCCMAHPGSGICRTLCGGLSADDAVAAFLASCRR